MHGLSRTFDATDYAWRDQAWTGRRLAGSVIYEMHVGTFTPEGTLDAAIDKLDHLSSLGVDQVEILPVNAFDGTPQLGLRRRAVVRRPGGATAARAPTSGSSTPATSAASR